MVLVQTFSGIMDRFVRSLFVSAGFPATKDGPGQQPMVLMAVGGYGRQELCLHSDVDLMVIHQGVLPSEMDQRISRALYPLWDVRLDVGHAVLTFRECVRLALQDFRMLLSLMDARFLLGARAYFDLFQEAFRSRIEREKPLLLDKFLVARKQRIDQYGGEAHFVEPDLKEGPGGLRDLHVMVWMSRIFFGCGRLMQMKRFAAFVHFDLAGLSRSRSFLLKLRNALHGHAGRREDRLLLSFQEPMARAMGYGNGPRLSGGERLMRDLYRQINRIRSGYEEFEARALDLMRSSPMEPVLVSLPTDLQATGGHIVWREGTLSERDPLLILKAFQEANEQGLFLGPGFIWEARKMISQQGRLLKASGAARKIFLSLLLNPKTPRVLRLALEMGLVELFIPEFKRVRDLPQYGFYHVMTVDLHSLETLHEIHQMARGAHQERWPILQQVFQGLQEPAWVYLAALLHDVGKGFGNGHAERGSRKVPRILNRLGLSEEARTVVSFLVRHHLLLVNISQRRDLSDEKTAVQVAQVIQDRGLLDMLLLLTVADSFATGPLARTDWKIMLLLELFTKVRRILTRGVLASADATRAIAEKRRAVERSLEKEHPRDQVLVLMDQVSSRYFLHTEVPDMIAHFRLALSLKDKRHQWVLRRTKGGPVTRVIQCTYDRPGLFCKMAGVFALNNMRIISANIFALRNGLAFDLYEVTDPPDPFRQEALWKRTLADLHLTLEDRLPLEERLQEKRQGLIHGRGHGTGIQKRVRIQNEASDFFTLIEVQAGNRMGLLYDVAKEITALGFDIRTARVTSDEERLTGVFYVRDLEGQKVYEEGVLARTRERLMGVL